MATYVFYMPSLCAVPLSSEQWNLRYKKRTMHHLSGFDAFRHEPQRIIQVCVWIYLMTIIFGFAALPPPTAWIGFCLTCRSLSTKVPHDSNVVWKH